MGYFAFPRMIDRVGANENAISANTAAIHDLRKSALVAHNHLGLSESASAAPHYHGSHDLIIPTTSAHNHLASDIVSPTDRITPDMVFPKPPDAPDGPENYFEIQHPHPTIATETKSSRTSAPHGP